MAKVTFEFTRAVPKSTTTQGRIIEGLSIGISVTELSPEGETGPHDAIAMILASQKDAIIQAAGAELLKALKNAGAEDAESFFCDCGNKH